MNFPVAWHHGALVPMDQATIPLANIEYAYGFGVYEHIRVQHGLPLFLDEHITRLFQSARVIELEHTLTTQQVAAAIAQVLTATPEETYNVKVLLTGARRADDALLSIMPTAPLFPDRKLYRDGCSVLTAHYERLFPNAKTLNMLPSYLHYRTAQRAGCYDALLVDRAGHITEGTRTNFFVIKDRHIITPPDSAVLQGVTRTMVLRVAAAHNFNVTQQDIPAASLADYDGAFITSTSSKIIPLKTIDDFSYPTIAPTIKELIVAFDEFLRVTGRATNL